VHQTILSNMLKIIIAISVFMSWFSIGSNDMKYLEEQIDKLKKMEDQDYDLWMLMEPLETEKVIYWVEKAKLDERKQHLYEKQLSLDEVKRYIDAKKKILDKEKQTLQQLQNEVMEGEYAQRMAHIDTHKFNMDKEKSQHKAKNRLIKAEMKSEKDQIEIEKRSIDSEIYKLDSKELEIKNKRLALLKLWITKYNKVIKLMKKQFEMLEYKINDERNEQIIEQKTKFLASIDYIYNFNDNLKNDGIALFIINESYKFLMELENNPSNTQIVVPYLKHLFEEPCYNSNTNEVNIIEKYSELNLIENYPGHGIEKKNELNNENLDLKAIDKQIEKRHRIKNKNKLNNENLDLPVKAIDDLPPLEKIWGAKIEDEEFQNNIKDAETEIQIQEKKTEDETQIQEKIIDDDNEIPILQQITEDELTQIQNAQIENTGTQIGGYIQNNKEEKDEGTKDDYFYFSDYVEARNQQRPIPYKSRSNGLFDCCNKGEGKNETIKYHVIM